MGSFRAGAVVLGIMLATSPVLPGVAQARGTAPLPGSPAEAAKHLNAQAQNEYEAGDLAASAATYSRIFEVLTENAVNRDERDNNLQTTLVVYMEAYRQAITSGQAPSTAVALLRQGLRVYDAYVAEYGRVYGRDRAPSPKAQESGTELERMLAEAEAQLTPPAPVKATSPARRPQTDVTLIRIDVPPGPSGDRLIVGGAVTMAAGLSMIAPIVIGAQRTKEANREQDRGNLEAADQKGRSGEALVITGAVLGGVLLAGGATMLGIGLRRRIRYQAFSPQVGRGYVGAGLQGRF